MSFISIYIVSLFIVLWLALLLSWLKSLSDGAPFIRYDIVKISMQINPNRWIVYSGWSIIDWSELLFRDENGDEQHVNLHFFDWLRFCHDAGRISKQERKQAKNENAIAILLAIQKDVRAELEKSNALIASVNQNEGGKP